MSFVSISGSSLGHSLAEMRESREAGLRQNKSKEGICQTIILHLSAEYTVEAVNTLRSNARDVATRKASPSGQLR